MVAPDAAASCGVIGWAMPVWTAVTSGNPNTTQLLMPHAFKVVIFWPVPFLNPVTVEG
jgi:hypothetical protein